jgi:hypothetical protein
LVFNLNRTTRFLPIKPSRPPRLTQHSVLSTDLLQQWRESASAIYVIFTTPTLKLRIAMAVIESVTEQDFTVESAGLKLSLSLVGVRFAMPHHTPPIIAEFGPDYEGKFVRLLMLMYGSEGSQEETCMLFEWLVESEDGHVS